MDAVDDLLGQDVLVQSVDVLARKDVEIPDWLVGTPTLVDTVDKTVFRGSEAVDTLQRMSVPPVNGEVSSDVEGRSEVDEAASQEEGPSQFYRKGGVNGWSFDEDERSNEFPSATSEKESDRETREGKITETELQKFMDQRNRQLPEKMSMSASP
jgi:hypothetical protein